KYPNVEFEIGSSVDLYNELESGKYDLVITGAGVGVDDFVHAPLFNDQLVCIMNNDHSLSMQSYVELKDFDGKTLISHAEKDNNKFYHLALKPQGIKPRRFMTIGQPQAIIEMVAAGFGIGVFPKWAVKSSIKANKLCALPIGKKGLPLTWNATFLKDSVLRVFHKDFINIVSKMSLTDSKI
ncbi:MAG: LysR family transcriptional regulator substrate-binding protein, partial [Desulfobacteraceae bacterium]|nr:LysR family transcriptional regulator substrate-binding protein [Desulfobacteraceae bacterium]